MKRLGAVTIKDIAGFAGVSHSTVSRALNDNPMINSKTRERIKKIAREHHFQFNAGARSLSIRKTGMIAIIYPAQLDIFETSFYTSRLFLELRHSLEHYQLDALVLEARNPKTGESNIKRLIGQNKVDGFLLIHSEIPREDYQLIQEQGFPLVQLHLRSRRFPLDKLDYFLTDNQQGGFLAGDYLCRQGCQNILVLMVSEDKNLEYHNRLEGFRRALRERGISLEEESIVFLEDSFKSAYHFILNSQERLQGVEALFAMADGLAFAALSALKELGFSVPGDMKVMGFDDAAVCTLVKPHITTIHQPREKISDLACRRISDLVENRGGEQKIQEKIAPRLVVRDTA